MQRLVEWWCNLIGIVDPVSVQIAGGIIAGAILYFLFLLVWQLVLIAISWLSTQ